MAGRQTSEKKFKNVTKYLALTIESRLGISYNKATGFFDYMKWDNKKHRTKVDVSHVF